MQLTCYASCEHYLAEVIKSGHLSITISFLKKILEFNTSQTLRAFCFNINPNKLRNTKKFCAIRRKLEKHFSVVAFALYLSHIP